MQIITITEIITLKQCYVYDPPPQRKIFNFQSQFFFIDPDVLSATTDLELISAHVDTCGMMDQIKALVE